MSLGKLQTTNYKLQTNQGGFSMIEMLIVLTVVVLISIGFFYKFRINKQTITEIAAKEMVYSIKEVKQKILSGDLVDIKANKGCIDNKCILGVNFLGGKTYRIFIEKSNPPDYSFGKEDILLEEKYLPQGISYLTDDFRDIFFESPYGVFQARGINGLLTDCSYECLLTVVPDEGGREAQIKINYQGLIYVD